MAYCTNCGAELGVGRFCTNCGARILPAAPTTESAETTVVEPRRLEVPPPHAPPPHAAPPRFAPAPPPPAEQPTRHKDVRSGFSPWWVVVLVLALAGSAGLAVWLTGQGQGGDEPRAAASSPTGAPADPVSPVGPGQGSGDQADLASTATVTGPRPIPPGLDLHNNRVEYPATNMLDDDPESAYRLAGDASGAVITFELAETSALTQVGLINGYTKIDTSGGSTVDWYPRNRRILLVEWGFDDGTSVEQALEPDVRELQLIEVDDVETRTVQLTILEVSAPGQGPRARDVTAISDVLLLGT